MSRDFTKEKKEELCRALDAIDEREWKPFMVWCGRRADEFGEWAERLGISSYTKQIDHFQERVLEINNSTRNQIDIVFEEVAETDRRYADTLWGHAETVREQVRRVQVMLQAMQSADRTGTERKVLLQGLRPQTEISHEEWLERGQRVLRSYLKVREDADPAEQQKICDLIMKRQPGMLASLYLKDYNSDKDASTIYHSIMEYYTKHKMDITIEDVEGLDLGERLDQKQKETFVACWNKLAQMGISEEHIIAAMANAFDESKFSATNAQDGCGYEGLYNDYEFKVDDHVGYGVFQWSNEDRKGELLRYANNTNGSVHELETQLDFFQYEMEVGRYKNKWKKFLATNDRDEAVRYFRDSIETTKASMLGKGNPTYEAELKKRKDYADKIADWYYKLCEQEVGER